MPSGDGGGPVGGVGRGLGPGGGRRDGSGKGKPAFRRRKRQGKKILLTMER
jgi:hypothetical protein